MNLLDKMIEDRIQSKYAEKESQFTETEKILLSRLNKSREYRIMLRDYQQELKERETRLNEREEQINQMEKSIKNRVLKDCLEEKEKIEKYIEGLKQYEKAMRKTECTIIDWFKRVDKKEESAFNEILEDVERFRNHNLTIDGYEFEEYIAKMMKQKGFQQIEVTKKSQDFGADVLAQKDGIKYVVQCKYYSSMVGIEAVQQIYAAKTHYDAHVAIVATNNVFTRAAKTLAKELNVVLWDCLSIEKMSQDNP
jgi:restriction system protein